jgi:hypothetical protein
MKIVSATLYCDRKPETKGIALKPLIECKLVNKIYVNIETDGTGPDWAPMLKWCKEAKPMDFDLWHTTSSWRVKPQYDQDQRRLLSIVRGRNMAIDYAIAESADYLLFVDSDVVIMEEDVETLLNMQTALCGGYVRGRGIHRENFYVFGEVNRKGPIIYCDHGTCGYMLIHKDVFTIQQFRYGWDKSRMHFLSEDPAYCQDWYEKSGQRFQINTEVTAFHADNPFEPLTEQGVARDAWESLRR